MLTRAQGKRACGVWLGGWQAAWRRSGRHFPRQPVLDDTLALTAPFRSSSVCTRSRPQPDILACASVRCCPMIAWWRCWTHQIRCRSSRLWCPFHPSAHTVICPLAFANVYYTCTDMSPPRNPEALHSREAVHALDCLSTLGARQPSALSVTDAFGLLMCLVTVDS